MIKSPPIAVRRWAAAVFWLSLSCWADVSAADPASGWVWEAAQPVPQARSEVSVATDGRFIYLLGGFAASRSPVDRRSRPARCSVTIQRVIPGRPCPRFQQV